MAQCLRAAGGMTAPERILRTGALAPLAHVLPQLRSLSGGDPFAAMVSYKGAPPPGWAMRVHGPQPVHIPLIGATLPPLYLTPFAAVFLAYELLLPHLH